jgi:hypothetical protein
MAGLRVTARLSRRVKLTKEMQRECRLITHTMTKPQHLYYYDAP